MIHKARHDNEKQVCETCKDFRRQNPRSRPLFRHRFDSAPGGSTERSEPQYRGLAVRVAVLGEDLGVPLAGDEVAEDREPGLADDVADDAREQEVHLGQGLLHALE